MEKKQNVIIELEKEKVLNGEGGKCRIKLQDILDQLPNEFFFEQSQKEIQNIIDCIHDGIYITDGDGKTLMLNKSEIIDYECLYPEGMKVENLVGVNVKEMVKNGHWDKSICEEVLRSGKEESLVVQVYDKSVLTTGIPHYENGKITRIVATDRDISKLEELQKEIKTAESRIQKSLARLEYEARIRDDNSERLIYKSDKMVETVNVVSKVAYQDVTVLIYGESGCGKELIANMIVKNSTRKNGPFIKINCGAIPENLIESELFGYEKGAFTGADAKGKIGLFEAADTGTILLDEIGELPLNLQTKLLRVLQEREIVRVGGSKSIPIDVRVIAATNANLRQKILDGFFREDLYYRLNIVPVVIPPLRERPEDIELLVKHFFEMFNKKYKMNVMIEQAAIEMFYGYSWPGNVRELKNVVERLIVTTEKDVIDKREAQRYIYHEGDSAKIDINGQSLKEQVENYEKEILIAALEKAKNGIGVSELLKISRSAVSKKFKKYGIKAE